VDCFQRVQFHALGPDFHSIDQVLAVASGMANTIGSIARQAPWQMCIAARVAQFLGLYLWVAT
jgi:hypothetical protein